MTIQVLNRACLMLEAVSRQGEVTMTSLSRQLNLPMSTVGRILGVLGSHGLVEKEDSTRRYRLGPRLIVLASRVQPHRSLAEICRPAMENLAAETGEDVGLAILQHHHAVIIARVYGPNPLKVIERLSEPVTLNCGAFRKVLLAFQNKQWIDEYLRVTEFKKHTENTITDARELLQELRKIRQDELALSDAEHMQDASGIAVPLIGAGESFVAALFLSMPRIRYSADTIPRFITALRQASTELYDKVQDGLLGAQT